MYQPIIPLLSLVYALFFAISSAAPTSVALSKRYPAVPKLVGAPVVIGAGTYPRANKLSDGSILGAYTAFEGGNNVIRIVLSTDNAQTWYDSLAPFVQVGTHHWEGKSKVK